ncbi:LamG domain-containing protein [Maribacter algicola]|uniref:LamG domain-containing protein n=1 Tax=Meishania litoralis TaxID=3434685 RepID=A0ACC7LH39_9FLAO
MNNSIVSFWSKKSLYGLSLFLVLQACSNDNEIEEKPYSEEPLLHYNFNGNFINIAGTGNNGIQSGGVVFAEDRQGNPESAAYFDGIDDRLKFENPLRESGRAYSISGWFKPEEPFNGNLVVVMRQGTVCNIRITKLDNSNSAVCFDNYIDSGWKNNCHDFDDDEWFHVVGVYQKDNHSKIYINGTLVAQQANANGSTDVSPDFTLDSYLGAIIREDTTNDPDTFWKGAIDDFIIYEKALNPTEVLDLYQGNGLE